MDRLQAFRLLRDTLAHLYDIEDAKRIIDDAGLHRERIPKGTSPRTFWHGVLYEAEEQGKIEDIIAAALSDYEGNSILQELLQFYKHQQVQAVKQKSDVTIIGYRGEIPVYLEKQRGCMLQTPWFVLSVSTISMLVIVYYFRFSPIFPSPNPGGPSVNLPTLIERPTIIVTVTPQQITVEWLLTQEAEGHGDVVFSEAPKLLATRKVEIATLQAQLAIPNPVTTIPGELTPDIKLTLQQAQLATKQAEIATIEAMQTRIQAKETGTPTPPVATRNTRETATQATVEATIAAPETAGAEAVQTEQEALLVTLATQSAAAIAKDATARAVAHAAGQILATIEAQATAKATLAPLNATEEAIAQATLSSALQTERAAGQAFGVAETEMSRTLAAELETTTAISQMATEEARGTRRPQITGTQTP